MKETTHKNDINDINTENDLLVDETSEKEAEPVKMITILRKFSLHPVASPESKKWRNRVINYFDTLLLEQNERIANNEMWIQNTSSAKKKKQYEENIQAAFKQKERINENKDRFCRVVVDMENASQADKDFIQNTAVNYTYDLIRRACQSEARRKNISLSYIFAECIKRDISSIRDIKEKHKAINEIFNYCNRKKTNPNSKRDLGGSLYDEVNILNPLEGYGFAYVQAFKSSVVSLIDEGVLEGKVSLTCYKNTTPVSIEGTLIGIAPDFDLIDTSSYKDLKDIMISQKKNIYVNLGGNGNPHVAKFSLYIGSKNNRNKNQLYSLLYKILIGEYKIGGSSIQINENKNGSGKKKKSEILINLCIKKPQKVKKSDELDENTVVGVDLGINSPAYCALNNSDVQRRTIGSKDEILRITTMLKHKEERLKDEIINHRRGHKKNDLQDAKTRIVKRGNNWQKNYNHIISRNIVNFALYNGAKYIHLENLSGNSSQGFGQTNENGCVLGKWSYYQLQQYIKYKAEEEGLVVKFVDAKNTSITCHHCGNVDDKQRTGEIFVCNNPDCVHYGEKINADFNAARNIAMSTNFVKGS